ncbi:MAG TPA: ATP-binding protein [Fimbriimonas sp.]|nr:ATP-binding protein [Fimbriimonas sp.]
MPIRSLPPLWSVCYVAAALLAIGAYVGVGTFGPYALALAAALIGTIGIWLHVWQSKMGSALVDQQAQADILRAQIEEQSQAIDSFADGLDLAVFICDPKATVIYANATARHIFQFPEPIGRSVMAITLSYDLEQLVIGACSSDRPFSKEISFGQDRLAIAKAWREGDSERVFLSVYEVTNLRRLERVRQDFVANVSHELRTPMSIIRAYAETLMEDDPPDADTARQYLPRIIDQVDRLSGITRDLLILSASESEPVQKSRCDIAEIFEQVVSQLRRKAEEKNLTLSYKGPESLYIEANPTQMSQVALNLIDNAINYTVRGGVQVSVDSVNGLVEIRVKDTGIGIAQEHASRIFERFYRVDKGRSRSTGGTGLGLSIVKHLIEAQGGTVSLQSALNEGSEFTVRLSVNSA